LSIATSALISGLQIFPLEAMARKCTIAKLALAVLGGLATTFQAQKLSFQFPGRPLPLAATKVPQPPVNKMKRKAKAEYDEWLGADRLKRNAVAPSGTIPEPSLVLPKLKDTVKSLLPKNIDADTVLAVASALAERDIALAEKEKQMALALAEKEKQRALAVAQKENLERQVKITEIFWEGRIHELQAEKLDEQRRYCAVLCNRFLLEMGLRKYSPGQRMIQAYRDFSKAYIFTKSKRKRLTQQAEQVSKALNNATTTTNVGQKDLMTELENLVHQLSRDIHYPAINETGFVCGGKDPTGQAVAVALCMLQAQQHLQDELIFVDAHYEPCATLKGGVVQQYSR